MKAKLDKSLIVNYKNFLFDCDGVLWKQNQLLPGAVEIIDKLKKLGKRILLVSNNSTITTEQYVEKCKNLKLNVSENEVIGSSTVLANYLQYKGFKGKIYIVGEEGISKELDKVNIPHTDVGIDSRNFREVAADVKNFDKDVNAVVVGFDSNFNLTKMTVAVTYISCFGCKFFATNADAVFPSGASRIPGTGSMVKAIETAACQAPVIVGKPYSPMFDVLKEKYNIVPEESLFIGDNLDTDILFANQHKMVSLLVFTGVTTPEDLNKVKDAKNKPRFYCNSLLDILSLF